MAIRKIVLTSLVTLASISSVSAAYTEVNCSTDPVFWENSCNQCFSGTTQKTGDNIWLLSDQWINTGDKSLILFKDEQDLPEMKSLNGAEWKQIPDIDKFWEYTKNMEALYNTDEWGYILAKWQKVDWIQSKLGYAYNLYKNTAEVGKNIGLLIYPISTHVIWDGWDVTVDTNTYKECVLFKSAEATKVTPPKQLPKTGPEHIVLLIVAMLLAFAVMKFTRSRV